MSKMPTTPASLKISIGSELVNTIPASNHA